MASPLPADALPDALAWADAGHRSALLAQGADAVRFIDNFTTAAIGPLAVGAGTETMFLDGRGWVIALAAALRIDDGLWIDAATGSGARLRDHLEHYHIRERVEFVDVSADRAAIVLAGPAAAAWLAGQGIAAPEQRFAHAEVRPGDVPARIVRVDWWSEAGWLIQCRADDQPRLQAWLRDQGVPEASAAALEAARIERGTPSPADIREKTLPQELCRDARAISFTKGCYLGQETVARIDALGHVNRRLVAVAVAGDVQAGAEVRGNGETMGQLTSVCRSPRLGSGLGLGILSTKVATTESLQVDGRAARIVEVPL